MLLKDALKHLLDGTYDYTPDSILGTALRRVREFHRILCAGPFDCPAPNTETLADWTYYSSVPLRVFRLNDSVSMFACAVPTRTNIDDTGCHSSQTFQLERLEINAPAWFLDGLRFRLVIGDKIYLNDCVTINLKNYFTSWIFKFRFPYLVIGGPRSSNYFAFNVDYDGKKESLSDDDNAFLTVKLSGRKTRPIV